jgi:hypothetical protein
MDSHGNVYFRSSISWIILSTSCGYIHTRLQGKNINAVTVSLFLEVVHG